LLWGESSQRDASLALDFLKPEKRHFAGAPKLPLPGGVRREEGNLSRPDGMTSLIEWSPSLKNGQ